MLSLFACISRFVSNRPSTCLPPPAKASFHRPAPVKPICGSSLAHHNPRCVIRQQERFQCKRAATPRLLINFFAALNVFGACWRLPFTAPSHVVSHTPPPASFTTMLAKASYPGVLVSFFAYGAPCIRAACPPLPPMWPTLQIIFSGVYIEEISVIPGSFRPEQEHACAKWTQSNAGDLFQQRCCWGGARTLRFFYGRMESE